MLSLWNHFASLLSFTALLIPIGILGFIRWGMWLLKRIPALFYRPIRNSYDTSATLITPVYKEDPALFRRAIESWIANKPDRIIAVIDVTDTTCIEIAHTYPEVEVMLISEPGKRPALAMGVDAATTDIVVLVDSDVIWEPDVLAKVKMPFADPKIGGVGTRQNMYPTDGKRATMWERLADIYLDIRYTDEVPATTLFKAGELPFGPHRRLPHTDIANGTRALLERNLQRAPVHEWRRQALHLPHAAERLPHLEPARRPRVLDLQARLPRLR